jgi:hypothetical protein
MLMFSRNGLKFIGSRVNVPRFRPQILDLMLVLVVAANVGTLASSGEMLVARMRSFEKLVELRKPSLIAFHFQELGGDKKDVTQIEEMRKVLKSSAVFADFVGSGIMCNADVGHEFTALGSAFFVRKSVSDTVRVLDRRLDEMVGLDCLTSQSDEARFLSFCRTEQLEGSRKGFLQVSFSVLGHRIEFINVHFPADLDNVQAAASVPSVYAGKRADCYFHTLERCGVSRSSKAVIAGDFNFRLDLKSVWETHHTTGGSDRIEPKFFRCAYVDDVLSRGVAATVLAQYDKELERLNSVSEGYFEELPRDFAPTYCLLDDGQGLYDSKRCPAWPDRVLLTKSLCESFASSVKPVYDAVTWNCDHRIVYLAFELSAAVPLEQRMRHQPDEELAQLGGRLVTKEGEEEAPRRRRGPSLWYTLTPLVAAAVIAATGYYLYQKIHTK